MANTNSKKEEFKLPTNEEKYNKVLSENAITELDLPSKGKLYPKDNVLSSGKVNVIEMTGKHENILLSQKYIKNGTQYDELLRQLVVEKYIGFKPEDLVMEDKLYLILAIRIINLGEDIKVTNILCPHCFSKQDETTMKLGELKNADRLHEPDAENTNSFTTTLPRTGDSITIKVLTSGDEKIIGDNYQKARKVQGVDPDSLTFVFGEVITHVNGTQINSVDARRYYEDLPILDTKHLQKFLSECVGNTKMTVDWTCPECDEISEQSISFSEEFFFPDL